MARALNDDYLPSDDTRIKLETLEDLPKSGDLSIKIEVSKGWNMYLDRSEDDRTDVKTLYQQRPDPSPLVEGTKSLYVQIKWRYDQEDEDKEDENTFNEMAERNIEEVVVQLCKDARNLQSLTIQRQFDPDHDESFDTLIDLPRNLLENAPSLQTLKFSLVSPPANSTFSLPNLTRINWWDPAPKTPARFERFIEFFRVLSASGVHRDPC